jgi:AraC-like DNA-binding protein
MCTLLSYAWDHLVSAQTYPQALTEVQLFLFQMLHRIETNAHNLRNAEIEIACAYINEHILEPLSLESLAKQVGYSLSYFKMKFAEDMGITPTLYINMRKIEQAKRMLAQGKSVTDTAMDLSFGSSNYFATVFRRFTAYSPSQFQQLLSKAEDTIYTHRLLTTEK